MVDNEVRPRLTFELRTKAEVLSARQAVVATTPHGALRDKRRAELNAAVAAEKTRIDNVVSGAQASKIDSKVVENTLPPKKPLSIRKAFSSVFGGRGRLKGPTNNQ